MLTRDYIRARDAHFYLLSHFKPQGPSISLTTFPQSTCNSGHAHKGVYQRMSITNHLGLRNMYNWVKPRGAINAIKYATHRVNARQGVFKPTCYVTQALGKGASRPFLHKVKTSFVACVAQTGFMCKAHDSLSWGLISRGGLFFHLHPRYHTQVFCVGCTLAEIVIAEEYPPVFCVGRTF